MQDKETTSLLREMLWVANSQNRGKISAYLLAEDAVEETLEVTRGKATRVATFLKQKGFTLAGDDSGVKEYTIDRPHETIEGAIHRKLLYEVPVTGFSPNGLATMSPDAILRENNLPSAFMQRVGHFHTITPKRPEQLGISAHIGDNNGADYVDAVASVCEQRRTEQGRQWKR